jgi:hypothetical protein
MKWQKSRVNSYPAFFLGGVVAVAGRAFGLLRRFAPFFYFYMFVTY